MPEIAFEQVSKVYDDGTLAVDELDLVIEDAELLVIVGPSGCGKTTALRMLAGLEEISDGEIRIGEQVVNELTPKERDIAMVFQNYALYPHMSVEQNLAFGLRFRKLPKSEVKERVRRAADLLEIDELLDKKPRALSGGQRQRVAMGRAIVREPQAFLMDEPLSNLDAKLRVQMRAEIHDLQRRLRVTTLYVTHDQVEAMTLGDRVAVMLDGRLQQVDPPQALYERPVNEFVAGFIGSPSINMVEAELERANGALGVSFGGHRLAVDDVVIGARRPRELRRPHGSARDPPRAHRGRRAPAGYATRPADSHDVRSDRAPGSRGARALHGVSARPRRRDGERRRPHARRLSARVGGGKSPSGRSRGSAQQDHRGQRDRARRGHEPPLLLRPGDARGDLGRLALDGAGGEAGEDAPLEHEREHDQRHGNDRRWPP